MGVSGAVEMCGCGLACEVWRGRGLLVRGRGLGGRAGGGVVGRYCVYILEAGDADCRVADTIPMRKWGYGV